MAVAPLLYRRLPPRPTLQRVLLVLLHVGIWAAIALLPLVFTPVPEMRLPPVSPFLLLLPTAVLAAFFYLNYFVLVPRLLGRRRFVAYFTVVAAWLLILLGAPTLFPLVRFGLHAASDAAMLANILRRVTMLFVLTWLVSTVLRVVREWLQQEKQREQLAADQLAAELAFLRSQISPHFLFNTLNNVYSLAELKSDDAPAAILKLASLMRYMLYEASASRVSLSREVQYLDDYVDLQRLRLDTDLVPIQLETTGDLSRYQIEPMLLIPFVENAFKHGVSYQHPSRIGIRLSMEVGGILHLHVTNLRPPRPLKDDEPGGVGLENVAKRLYLLYADRYDLVIDDAPTEFAVRLTLQLQPQ